MPKLGSPKTNQFNIGTAEVRVGPLASANKLTQAHSVGLVDDATLEVSQTSVELLGGFPQQQVDSAIISQEASLTATLREYSKRNLDLLLGEGVTTYAADVKSLVVADAAVGAVALDVTAGEGALFPAGTIVCIYKEGAPEEVTIARVESVLVDTITLDAGTPTLFAYAGTTDTIHIFQAQPTAIGAISGTNYFATQLVQIGRSKGRPIVVSFWKGSISAGLSYATSATDFASTELGVKFLQPSAADYATGGSLEHLANIIPTYPTGLRSGGGDL